LETLRTPAGWCRGVVLDPRDARFYPEQEEDVNIFLDKTLIYGKRKSRRCGWSHALTRGAVAACHLQPDMSVYFVSMNLADAYKKIEECKKFYYQIHPQARLPVVAGKDNRTTIAFQHSKSQYSEIVATFHPRGMPGRNLIIIIDEADHILDLQATLDAAIPNIVQGNSKVIIGGSVHRDHGPFFDMFNLDLGKVFGEKEAALLKEHIVFKELYWWQVPWLLNRSEGTKLKTAEVARVEAPKMKTIDRVKRFGSERLQLAFAMMPLEDFRQEYELYSMREGSALIDWDLILRASDDYEHTFFDSLRELLPWAFDNHLSLVAGYDVGHRSNTSELTIFGYDKATDMPIEAYRESINRRELEDQEKYIDKIMQAIPQLIMAIDEGGPGAQMARSLERRYPGRIIAVNLEYYSRKGILDNYARRFENGKIKLVYDKDRQLQIHSIKKKIGESGRVIYYVPRKEKHHADVAISQALACHVIDQYASLATYVVYTGSSMIAQEDNPILDEIAGGHEEFMRDVINA